MKTVPRIQIVCSCGVEFLTKQSLLDIGKGKFCSTSCARSKPVPEAQKQIQREKMLGRHSSPATQFKKGHTAWNTGLKYLAITGDKNPRWKGDNVGYAALHDWVERELGTPSKCEHCEKTEGRFEWANISHEYYRTTSDWQRLCHRCHVKYDRESGAWGLATRRFGL